MIKRRLVRLVRALASPESEIVGGWWVGEKFIDSIEVDGNDLILCLWDDKLEYQVDGDILTDEEMLELINQLEQILLN